MMSRRQQLLAQLAQRIPPAAAEQCTRVAIDGPDGSGKTTLADELAVAVRRLNRPVVRISLDDFHNLRAVRYRQGSDSPEGFWQDSYNYQRFQGDVLDPFGPGGSRLYRTAAHDLATDAIVEPEPRRAVAGTVLIVDGLFLHRDELAGAWDLTIYLDVPFAVTAARMAARDGSNPDPEHPSMRRYVEAQRIYFRTCSPRQRAGIVVDNRDPDHPTISSAPGGRRWPAGRTLCGVRRRAPRSGCGRTC